MGIFSENRNMDEDRKKIVAISKIGAPILKAVHYLSMLAAVLAAIIAVIVIFIGNNKDAKEMMLPPFMSYHETPYEYYSLTVGDGIRLEIPEEKVTAKEIKTVVQAEIIVFVAYCIVIAPVALFMSKFMKNIAKNDGANPKNHRNLMYIGMSVAVGGIVIGLARSIYNYMLISGFTPESTVVKFSFGVDFGGILIGLMIIVFSYFLGDSDARVVALTEKKED